MRVELDLDGLVERVAERVVSQLADELAVRDRGDAVDAQQARFRFRA